MQFMNIQSKKLTSLDMEGKVGCISQLKKLKKTSSNLEKFFSSFLLRINNNIIAGAANPSLQVSAQPLWLEVN
uniref:Uncharacterized protein n=1 Tax=Rhizophora mucronata TaxID=61149 RepID=A0A2P2MD77_RHIMU